MCAIQRANGQDKILKCLWTGYGNANNMGINGIYIGRWPRVLIVTIRLYCKWKEMLIYNIYWIYPFDYMHGNHKYVWMDFISAGMCKLDYTEYEHISIHQWYLCMNCVCCVIGWYIQWGKTVFSQPPIVQVLPLKKMRGLHHMYTFQLWQTKWEKKNPENHIVGFLMNLFGNYGGK